MDECARAQQYFHPTTIQPLIDACALVLIYPRLQDFSFEFDRMLRSGETDGKMLVHADIDSIVLTSQVIDLRRR